MSATAFARDPVAEHVATMADVARASRGAAALATVPFLAQIGVRLDPALAGRAPYPLPTEPNTTWEDGRRAALWLGPDEWLILGPPGDADAIVAELDPALAGLHRSIVDLSANRVAFELSGPARFELLSSGCSLDLDARAWRAGLCAQTLYAHVPVLLHERPGGVTRILARPSYAGALIDLLADAAGGLAGAAAADPALTRTPAVDTLGPG